MGLRRAWTWSGLVIRLGVISSCTIGVGTIVVGCVVTIGVGSVKIATNFLITCILSVPGCLNGVVGAGLFKAWVSSNATIVAASALESHGTLQ
jgi:hypothetical protein